jgi:uncharacterized protein YbjT (DUF2867 family)
MRTALLVGASGLVGGLLLRQLLEAPEYGRVIVLGRRPLGWSHPKLIELVVDVAALDRVAAEVRGDDAFCCLGTTIRQAGSRAAFRAVDHTAVLAFAWLARRQGAEQFFVVSSLGANDRSRVFYSRVKGEMEEALSALGFATLVIARPSLLAGDREALGQPLRSGEKIGLSVTRWLGPLIPANYRAIDVKAVARALLTAVRATKGQRIILSGELRSFL